MLKVAIAGAGTMGRVHSSSYRDISGAKVAAVYDLNEEKAKAAGSMHGAKCCTDFDEMLRDEEIDIVDICLPTFLHKEYALKAIARGKHVFCEKPIALTLKDAREMIDEAKKKGVKFTVGHVVRFFPAYSHALQIINDGRIGVPKLVRTTRTGSYPHWSWNNWYGDYSISGGPLVDLVIHDFDWIRYAFGDVERVFARDLYDRNLKDMDHCLVTLRLKNGMIAHIEGSWAYPAGSIFGSTFEIIGTTGQIESDSRESSPIKKHALMNGSSRIYTDSPLFSDEEPYTRELQEFVSCIKEDRDPLVSGEDAVKALEISLAAVKSARAGEPSVIGGEGL